MSKNAGTTDAELERMGMRPHEPRMGKLPVWRPFVREPEADTEQGEAWTNGRYDCVVVEGELIPWGSVFVHGKRIQVCNFDQSARHDWRDFQRIKNELAGEEWEAVEVYPAESRLRDPSNAFYLWCYPPGVITDLGFSGRVVCTPDKSVAPQRRFDA